jgi:large subunit ribosomal protein L9
MAVKIILKQHVPNLGEPGEVKQVAPGYFRNYLLPRGLAVEASAGHMRALEARKTEKAGKTDKAKERTSTLAGQLGDITVRIPVKLGEQGRIYGSVTNKDIAEALAEQANVEIDRHKIELREPLKSIGSHEVSLRLEHGIDAHVNVELIPETESA